MAASVVASVSLPISNNFSFAPSMDAYGKLSEYGKLGAWSPLSLFAASEVGAWYDPSDLTTMFQDSAGTTPVTADGQPVGLILDKSKGLVRGPELVTNGDFSSTSNWNQIGSGMSISGGYWVVTAVANNTGYYQGSASFAGGVYEITVVVSSVSSGAVTVTLGIPSPTELNCFNMTTPGTYTFKQANYTADTNLRIYSVGASTTATIDSVSVKIVSGNHAVAPSDAARPLKTSTGLSSFINYDAVDDVLNSTFPSSLGSSCTVCRANVGSAPTILTAQTIGTSYADSTDHAGLIIINRALTGQETTDVTAWLLAKGAT